MSINPIRFSGLASGIDTESMIQQLMQVQRMPLDKLNQNRQILEWQQEEYRSINSLLMNFRSNVLSPLRLQGSFMTKTASLNDTSLATVTATNGALEGLHTLTVTQMAKGASLSSEADTGFRSTGDELTSSAVTLDLNGTSISLAAGTTVGSFVSAVNAKSAQTGVKVSFDSTVGRFFFNTTSMGEKWDSNGDGTVDASDKDVEIDFSANAVVDGSTSGAEDLLINKLKLFSDESDLATDVRTGQNAIVSLNDSTNLEYMSNSFTVNGLSIQLKANSGTADITVTRDADAVFNRIKDFVDKYNELIDTVNQKLLEKRYRDHPPLTAEQKVQLGDREIELWEEKARSGLLRNDSLLTSSLSGLRSSLSGAVTPQDNTWSNGLSNSALNHLSELGIETGEYTERGKLHIKDEAKLRKAIEENPDDVMMLFTARPQNASRENVTDTDYWGLAFRLYEEVNRTIDQLSDKAGSSTSFSQVDDSFIGGQLKKTDERISTLEYRLTMVESRYWKQFTAMERALNQLNSQSAWLAQQLSSLNGGA